MRGLTIKEPWVSKILSGEKTWEIRSTNCLMRERIGVIRSGSGTIVGTVDVVDAIGPLTREQLLANVDKHQIPATEVDNLVRYKKPYAWVLANPKKLPNPIPYKHNSGAVTWVAIDHIPT